MGEKASIKFVHVYTMTWACYTLSSLLLYSMWAAQCSLFNKSNRVEMKSSDAEEERKRAERKEGDRTNIGISIQNGYFLFRRRRCCCWFFLSAICTQMIHTYTSDTLSKFCDIFRTKNSPKRWLRRWFLNTMHRTSDSRSLWCIELSSVVSLSQNRLKSHTHRILGESKA